MLDASDYPTTQDCRDKFRAPAEQVELLDTASGDVITLDDYIKMLETLRDSVPSGGSLRVQKWVAGQRINAHAPRVAYMVVRAGRPQFWHEANTGETPGPACIRV